MRFYTSCIDISFSPCFQLCNWTFLLQVSRLWMVSLEICVDAKLFLFMCSTFWRASTNLQHLQRKTAGAALASRRQGGSSLPKEGEEEGNQVMMGVLWQVATARGRHHRGRPEGGRGGGGTRSSGREGGSGRIRKGGRGSDKSFPLHRMGQAHH